MRRAHQGKHSHENRAIGHRLKLHGRFLSTLMLCGLLASSTVLPAQAVGLDVSDAPGNSVVEATEISEEAGTEPESTEPEAELDESDAGESGSKTDDSGADEPLATEREISESSSDDSAKASERLAVKARGLNDFQQCAVEVYAVTANGQVAEYPSGSLSGGWSSLNGLSNSVNALGIAPGGASAYAVERNTGKADAGTIKSILKYENGEYSRVPNSGISSFGPVDTTGLPSGARLEGDQSQAGVVAGAVSPDNGHFYFGGFERVKYRVGSSTSSSNPRYMRYTLVYFEYDPVTDQIHGPKRASLPPLLLNDKDHYPSANGDFAFDSEGNLFILSGTDQEEAGNPLAYYNNAHVYRIGKQSLQSANPTATRVSMSGITGSGHNPRMGYANGIAFNGAGNMVISIGASAPYNAREYRSQNGSWSLVSSNSTSIAATDLASCESPSTLTIQKNVTERAGASDQFELSLASSQGGTPFETATTDGSDPGVQTEKIGPTIVSPGSTYYFSEAGANGTGTDMADYTSSYACVNMKTGATIRTESDVTSGQVTIPADPAGSSVVCTITNEPKAPATIKVYVGTDRIAGTEGNATPRAGVTLRLGPASGNTTAWAAYDWATCVSDADGWCTFTVPLQANGTGASANGMAKNARPWVSGVSAPSSSPDGNISITTEWGIDSGGSLKDYSFRVDRDLSAGIEVNSKTDSEFMRNSSANTGGSFGQWATIRENPRPLDTCDVNVAFVNDLSSSISNPTDQLPDMKTAIRTVVNSLTGTQSKISLFSFDKTSAASNGSNHPELMPVSNSTEANEVKSKIESWGTASGTNWDAGLYAAAMANEPRSADERYDMVIFLTDGAPTWYGTPGHELTSGTTTGAETQRVRSLEAGIFSANLLKKQGSRVVGFGVFSADHAPLNLSLTTGPVRKGPGVSAWDADYFVSPDYKGIADQLQSFLADCAGSLEVEKRVINEGATVPANATAADLNAISSPASGWEISAEGDEGDPSNANVAPDPGPFTTGDNGKVTIPVRFKSPDATGTITVTETQQDGYSVVPVSGKNLVCTDADGDPVDVTNIGDAASPGGQLTLANAAEVSCVIYNQQVGGEVTWGKVDNQTPGNRLSGSVWTLVGPAGAGSQSIEVNDCVADTAAECANETDVDHRAGYFKVTDLAWGEYQLSEHTAPPGYLKTDEIFTFKIGPNESAGEALSVEGPDFVNQLRPALIIPLTGGLGSDLFLVGGGILVSLLIAGLIYRQRRLAQALSPVPSA